MTGTRQFGLLFRRLASGTGFRQMELADTQYLGVLILPSSCALDTSLVSSSIYVSKAGGKAGFSPRRKER